MELKANTVKGTQPILAGGLRQAQENTTEKEAACVAMRPA
jgi:hypothetical protein